MILKPVAGIQVPDPYRGGVLPPEGRECGDPLNQYWLRRLADGDVTKADAQTPQTAPSKSPNQKGN